MMEEERVSKHGRGVRTRGGVTLPRTFRRKRREEEEKQEMELQAMREILWSMYDDGDNTVSVEVHRPLDDSQVNLSIRVDPEKQLHAILVPHTTTRHSSPVALEFVSQTIMPFGSPTPTDVEGQEESSPPPPVAGGEAETSDHPFRTLSPSTTITTHDQANVTASPVHVQVEGQEESRPTPVAGCEAETSDHPSSTRSVSIPSTTTMPELVIDLTLPDPDTSDSVDTVSHTPPPQQVTSHSSRPPPVAGGASEPKENESTPTTITTP